MEVSGVNGSRGYRNHLTRSTPKEMGFSEETFWRELLFLSIKKQGRGFPGGAVVESPPANAGDTGSRPGLEIGRAHV